jgi:hypothetical protein
MQSKQADECWMLNVLRGRLSVPQLISDLEAVLPTDEAERLYCCVKNNPLRYRRRAVAMLSLSKGIKKTTIQEFLKAGGCYVDRVASHYQEEGIIWFNKHVGKRCHSLNNE